MKNIEGLGVPDLACRLDIRTLKEKVGRSSTITAFMGMREQPLVKLPDVPEGYLDWGEEVRLPVRNVFLHERTTSLYGIRGHDMGQDEVKLGVLGFLLTDRDQAKIDHAASFILGIHQSPKELDSLSVTILGTEPLEQLTSTLDQESPLEEIASFALEALGYVQAYACRQTSLEPVRHIA